MAKKPPGESAEDRAARLRERRIAGIERDTASQGTAGDLTADLRSVYGLRGIPLMFGAMGKPSQSGAGSRGFAK